MRSYLFVGIAFEFENRKREQTIVRQSSGGNMMQVTDTTFDIRLKICNNQYDCDYDWKNLYDHSDESFYRWRQLRTLPRIENQFRKMIPEFSGVELSPDDQPLSKIGCVIVPNINFIQGNGVLGYYAVQQQNSEHIVGFSSNLITDMSREFQEIFVRRFRFHVEPTVYLIQA